MRKALIGLLFALPLAAQFIPPPLPAPAIPVPVISDPGDLTAIFESLMGGWYSTVWPYAREWFWALAFLEFSFFGWELWRKFGGDIRTALLETTNKVLVLGIFLAILMNANVWMSDIIDSFITIGKSASGLSGINPSDVLKQGIVISNSLLTGAKNVGFLTDFATAFPLTIAAIFICLGFLFVCAQFVITKIQTFICLGAGVVMLGMGGSKWTRSYVERYIQFCVVCGLKLMVLYLLVGGANTVVLSWVTKAKAAGSGTGAVGAAMTIMCGAILYAIMCWFASSMISAILGGSPNMTHTDVVSFMGPMIAAGVASGLAAAGIASAASGGGKAAAQTPRTPAAASSGGAPQQSATAAAAGSGGGRSAASGGSGGRASAAGAMLKHAASGAHGVVNAASRMPNDRGGHHPPSFSGFHG